MEPWRAKAIEMFPERTEDFAGEDTYVDSPMMLWIELRTDFERAYEEPRNEDVIERVYAFAHWCLEHGQRHPTKADQDLPSCVYLCLYEHIPDNEAARLDMPRWFTRDAVIELRSVFTYHFEDWDRLMALYPGPPVSKRKARREEREANRRRMPWSDQHRLGS